MSTVALIMFKSISELLLGGQLLLDGLPIKLHQLTGVLGHQLVNDRHLLGGERATLLELIGEGGEDDRVHAAEAHLIVIAHNRLILLVRRLIAEDGEESSLSPANVGAEFGLEGDERLLFIHHTHIMTELYWTCKLYLFRIKTCLRISNTSTYQLRHVEGINL